MSRHMAAKSAMPVILVSPQDTSHIHGKCITMRVMTADVLRPINGRAQHSSLFPTRAGYKQGMQRRKKSTGSQVLFNELYRLPGRPISWNSTCCISGAVLVVAYVDHYLLWHIWTSTCCTSGTAVHGA